MPVAKLSREFYDRFGDKITDELVNCLNSIESNYRGELRDLFDAHFGRFEQQLEHRLAEARADLRQEIAAVRVDLRREIAAATADLRQEIAASTAELRGEITALRLELERRMDARFAALDERVSKQFHWLVGGQLTVLLAVIGVLAGAFFAR